MDSGVLSLQQPGGGAPGAPRGEPPHILLINPTIAARKHARFPLAVLNLSAALDGHYRSSIIDGNIDRDFISTALRTVAERPVAAVGVSVMGGPQLPPAIAVSQAIRARFPDKPIIWGGHFPTICAGAALNEPYVDYAVRGQGEDTLREVLDAHLGGAGSAGLERIAGLSWRRAGETVHNRNRAFSSAGLRRELPYGRLGHQHQHYLQRTFLGARTSGYQAALGCRFRCTFCGVAAMFRGKTELPAAARLDHDLSELTRRFGVDSLQFYDNNFFDREEDTLPLLDVLAHHQLPWWCFARSDALLNLSAKGWSLVRRSQLRMTYIGAESPSDWLLHDVRKGTRNDQTAEAVELCHRNGVIPELSFMLAPPQDPEGETERTFEYIRHIKSRFPRTEIMLYVYSPLPPAPGIASPHVERSVARLRNHQGEPLIFPDTAAEWAEDRWVDYWCHKDVPWMTDGLRQRIRDFTTVLGCRFPTATDIRSSRWSKSALRALASWRYRYGRYGRPWELAVSKKFVRLLDPRVSGL
jgi:anaerobic magnesium-protoporphyrin IX monomethyl ester cyclase